MFDPTFGLTHWLVPFTRLRASEYRGSTAGVRNLVIDPRLGAAPISDEVVEREREDDWFTVRVAVATLAELPSRRHSTTADTILPRHFFRVPPMSRALSAITCVTLLAGAACSSATEPTPPALSGASALRAATVFSDFSQGADRLRNATPSASDSTALACPKGGSYKTTADASGATISASVVYVNCGVADSTGQVWTFTSLPKLAITITPTLSDSVLTTVSTVTGAVRVESTGVLGTCSIDSRMRVDSPLSPPITLRVRQTGQVCGQVVDTTWTVTLPSS